MVWLVVATIILNLGIGFAMAVGLPSLSFGVKMPRLSRPTEDEESKVTVQVQAKPAATSKEIKVEAPEVSEDIPEDWFELLEDAGAGETKSFIEASVQVLRLEVGRYRDELIAVDARVRECLAEPGKEAISNILEDLRVSNQEWLERQAEAAGYLSDRQGTLGSFSKMGALLEDILLEQQAQIETTCSNIDVLDFSTDESAGCKRLILEICKLLDMAHILRDRMHESLMSIMVSEGRLESLDKKLQIDSLTGLINRTGLETTFCQWWRDDPNRKRQLSLILVDIDRFSKINERYGALNGDLLIGGFGKLIDDCLRKNRGFDLVARCEGQRFALFTGDTGPQNATSCIERVRQTLEASTFELEDQKIELTASCGVTEVNEKDTSDSVFDRLKKTVREAKRAGRNCTFLDSGEGPTAVKPPEYNVQPQTIRIS